MSVRRWFGLDAISRFYILSRAHRSRWSSKYSNLGADQVAGRVVAVLLALAQGVGHAQQPAAGVVGQVQGHPIGRGAGLGHLPGGVAAERGAAGQAAAGRRGLD